MTSTFLTPEEVYYLTGRNKKSAQALELKRMKIQHWINASSAARRESSSLFPRTTRLSASYPQVSFGYQKRRWLSFSAKPSADLDDAVPEGD